MPESRPFCAVCGTRVEHCEIRVEGDVAVILAECHGEDESLKVAMPTSLIEGENIELARMFDA